MKRLSILPIILLLFSLETFCQNQNKRSINFGLTSMNFYSKFYMPDYSGIPISQTAATCFEFNFIDQVKIGNRWYIPIGGGISEKGWIEKGHVWYWCGTDRPAIPPTYKWKNSGIYLNLQLGLSYDLISFKRFTFNVGQLITPEYALSPNPEYFRAIVFSTRTNLALQYNISKKIGLQLIPFFQTALQQYNKKVSNPNSSDWTPYGYGATLGILW